VVLFLFGHFEWGCAALLTAKLIFTAFGLIAIFQMLYFHVPSRHPSSTPELELPTLLQSAAVMGIGLLYEGSAHALTMKILLVLSWPCYMIGIPFTFC
jgi:hypothetical protein